MDQSVRGGGGDQIFLFNFKKKRKRWGIIENGKNTQK